MQAKLYPRILAAMKPGATLGLSHGFLLGVMKNDNVDFRKDINVVLVAPKVCEHMDPANEKKLARRQPHGQCRMSLGDAYGRQPLSAHTAPCMHAWQVLRHPQEALQRCMHVP